MMENKDLDELINDAHCPISMQPILDPVIACDGVTYDRSQIEQWFLTSDKSPITNKQLTSKTLTSNNAVKNLIAILLKTDIDFKESYEEYKKEQEKTFEIIQITDFNIKDAV